MKEKLLDILKKHWGYSSFRPMQYEIISDVLSGKDTLALLPTGGGKSMTYQLPTMVMEGMCIVITPLIALMKDQVDTLRAKGISAVAIHSGLSDRQIDIALDNCVYGDVKFLYIAPERIKSDIFILRAGRMDVSLIAVDEAHCISQWGYDFRPSYLHLTELREMHPKAPILALTASATENVAKDIMDKLSFRINNIRRSSFARPNISYVVRNVVDKFSQVVRILESIPGSGIIYARKRNSVEQLCKDLRNYGFSASYYHAGLPSVERTIRQEEWVNGEVRVMVATSAFGMGIDKADVRFVIHYSASDSLENYYQESGRAGRDGNPSYAVMLVADRNFKTMRRRLRSKYPPLEKVKRIYEQICSYLQIAIGDGKGASYAFNVYQFSVHEHYFPAVVLGAIDILERNEYITYIDESDNPARMIFRVSRDELYKIDMDRVTEGVISIMMRIYHGLFTDFRAINEQFIAAKCYLKEEVVHQVLKDLWRRQIITYIPASTSAMIHMNEERLPTSDIYIAPSTYSQRMEQMLMRFEAIVDYTQNQTMCRSQFIGGYFGDKDIEPCGCCDICRAKRKLQKAKSVEELIKEHIADTPCAMRQLSNNLLLPLEQIDKAVLNLVDTQQVSISKDGTISLASDTLSE